MPEKFYLTTPIYYVNARPHIGHAYTTIAADVIARRHRLLGHDTFFLTGTDEHGQKIERSAAAAGIAPQQFADEVSASFQTLWKRMGITNDAFIRTTSDAHKRGAQKLFADLHTRGQIYLSSYTGQYSIGEEMFVDGPPGTIGPDGKPTETVTEENFFFKLSDFQLPLLDLIESDTLHIQPEARKNEVLSFLRGNVTEATKTPVILSEAQSAESKDLRFSALGNPYVPGALRDLSVSRSSFTWGIPVPEEVQRAAGTTQPHVIYVWLDALANYMTALGYGSDDPMLFEKFWPADLHLVGKEIIRFHCVYWPAFLLAANVELPKAVTAHGWLLFDDSKMSKSKGNIVRAETILDAFGTLCPPVTTPPAPYLLPPTPSSSPLLPPDSPLSLLSSSGPDLLSSRSEAEGSASPTSRPPTKPEQDLFATDVLRYFLLREIPFGQDGSFSFDALWNRYNSELTNGYGNLVSRTLTMVASFLDGYLPIPDTSREYAGNDDEKRRFALESAFSRSNQEDSWNEKGELLNKIQERDVYQHVMRANDIQASSALDILHIFLAVSITDRYLSDHEPWKLAKSTVLEDQNKLKEVLAVASEAIRIITALLHPILPYATTKVWMQLGLGKIERAEKGSLANLIWGDLAPGTKLGPLSPIFPRADKGLAQIMIDMEAAKSAPAPSQLVDEKTTATPEPQDTNHPGAGPRTATLDARNPGSTVGGSNALTTERTHTPHTEAAASGIFAGETATPQIAIDDFTKVDLRVAQIVVAERIPKADKLLRLEVDLGPDFPRRQILSGIAEWYTPEELLGRRIVIIANLAPRKMRGLESHGMLLAASSGENTKPVLTTFGEEIALGSRVR